MLDHEEIIRLYGPWHHRTPSDAAELCNEYSGLWWIAGGWAIEAFTGKQRPHSDLDVSIPRSDVALLRQHVMSRLEVWAANKGTLWPLIGEVDEPLPSTFGNLWLRASGAEPWEYDVILMDATDSVWTYKRDTRIHRLTEDILWTRDSINYLWPEIQLLHKAPGLRPKDQADFESCLPLLESADRRWLRSAMEVAHPEHPWLNEL
ncbi:nucleotidyltransferase domain-containing protein [Arthrobacter flavus]|uniref:Nucleotidyltransferase domain-containing protein n=1 Tax=Arthrobacter flavus TaxID=95172 RepID=A0ABW4Q6Z1_9MICC